MIVSAASLENNARINADLVIVGGGAAGITIAKRFSGTRFRVVMLEGGGQNFEDSSQSLYKGAIVGQHIEPIDTTRLRYFGGTTNHWAGWCRPLEQSDFRLRSDWAESGWPITSSDLDPYYQQAVALSQLGQSVFDDLPFWRGQASGKNLTPLAFDAARLKTAIFQISPPTRFAKVYGPELEKAGNVRVLLDSTVLEFLPMPGARADQTRKTVSAARVVTKGNKAFTVSAPYFVVATGGIETARLLLLSDKFHPAGAGNENDVVGRYFMDHPWIMDAGYLRFAKEGFSAPLYFDETLAGGSKIFGAITPTPAILESEQIGSFRIVLHASRVSNAGADSVRSLMSDVRRGSLPTDLGEHLGNIVSDFDVLADSAYKTITGSKNGWMNADTTGPYKGAFIDLNIEPRPNRTSRVMLDNVRDSNNQRKVKLDWRLAETDKRTAARALDIVAHEFGRLGLGRTRVTLNVDKSTPWPKSLIGSCHHSGTARMGLDPMQSVVDGNCRIHSMTNLYVAGSAVFPTIGYANPTLTIVALASRLAGHLQGLIA